MKSKPKVSTKMLQQFAVIQLRDVCCHAVDRLRPKNAEAIFYNLLDGGKASLELRLDKAKAANAFLPRFKWSSLKPGPAELLETVNQMQERLDRGGSHISLAELDDTRDKIASIMALPRRRQSAVMKKKH